MVCPQQESEGAGLPEREERELIREAQSGDRQAFGELFRRHQRNVYALALRMTGNAHDAEDITQDVLIRVMKGIRTFRFRSRFSTWLYRITANTVNDHLARRASREKKAHVVELNEELAGSIESDPGATSPEELAISRETREAVQAALMRLPEKYRMPLLLVDLHEFTYEEVSRILRLPTGTVKSRLFHARRGLAGILKADPEQSEDSSGLTDER